jgi:hypothetical protein
MKRKLDFEKRDKNISDKWIKIIIKYNGDYLTIIHSILTLFNISYA